MSPDGRPTEEASSELGVSSTVFAPAARSHIAAMPARFQVSLPVWRLWSEIAIDHYHLAKLHRLEAVTAREDEPDQSDLFGKALNLETKTAMVAVSAAMHALDGFYGSTKDFIDEPTETRDVPATSIGGRPSVIFTMVRCGFAVRQKGNIWPKEAKELFAFRDSAVQSKEKPRDVRLHGLGVATAPEHVDFSLETAERAVTLLVDVLSTCQSNPKPQYMQLRAYMDRLEKDIELLSARLDIPLASKM